MWTITQLKNRGMYSVKKNYWRAVFVALVVLLIGGSQCDKIAKSVVSVPVYAVTQCVSSIMSSVSNVSKNRLDMSTNMSVEDGFSYPGNDFSIDFDDDEPFDYTPPIDNDNGLDGIEDALAAAGAVVLFIVFFVILIGTIILAVSISLKMLLFNPLEVGTVKFYVQNLNTDGEVGSIGYAFDHHYKNQIKTMFFRSLFQFGWTLLFVVPGIIKAYEYRMVPYILSEYPDMDPKMVFETSKRMMDGEKWNAFVLDISFIGWWILSGITGGILGVFFVNPYYYATCAALYEALKIIKGAPIPVQSPDYVWNNGQQVNNGWQQDQGPQEQGQSWQSQPQAGGEWQVQPQAQPQDNGEWQVQPQAQPQDNGEWQVQPQSQPQVGGEWQVQPQSQPQVGGEWQVQPQTQPQVGGEWQVQPQPEDSGQWEIQNQQPVSSESLGDAAADVQEQTDIIAGEPAYGVPVSGEEGNDVKPHDFIETE